MLTGPARRTRLARQLSRADLFGFLTQSLESAKAHTTELAVLVLSVQPKDRLLVLTDDRVDGEMSQALAALPTLLRSVDRFAFVGERQVCVVLPTLTNPAQPWLAAHKLSRAICAGLSDRSGESWVRALVGIACFPKHGVTAQSLLACADSASVEAASHEEGIFSPDADAPAWAAPVSRMLLLEVLRANDFRLVFQPQLDLATGNCSSAEVLLRLNGERSQLSPALLASFAEHEGKIGQLTAGVLNGALRQVRMWLEGGIRIHVAVNLSPLSLRDHALPAMVARSLESWEVAPDCLTLEIVESSMIHNFAQAAAILHELRSIGVRLSVDDFGTGYSCLAYLRQLPLNELKVDQSLVRNLLRSREDRQLVQATIDLAHNFELKAVAEGVESESMWNALTEMGCDFIQGFALSRPLEIEEFLPWLQQRSWVAAGFVAE
ncbi:MAG TPA: GGDEF domain-containing phosphodiesterase [Burkholderiales bacterium]|nr:GGDEF domain-containing phosphodiesterase [Burkholderiales bacterium]